MRNLEKSISVPVRRREDAANIVHVKPRRVTLTGSTGLTRFAPEPVLADADFEAALKNIEHQCNQLERTPELAPAWVKKRSATIC